MKKIIFDEMKRMQRRMNRWVVGFDENPWNIEEDDLSDYRKPMVDARELANEFVIVVELPGVEKKDVEITVEDGSLVVKVERKKEKKETDEEEGKYIYKKEYSGFYRRIPMPENANLEKIDASYLDGVLKLSIPKRERKKSGQIVKVR